MERLETKTLYHIYNRAIGSEKLFTKEDEYAFFLSQFKKYTVENTKIYAYCLMPNHYHFLMEFTHELNKPLGKQLSNCFNSYTKTFNKKHKRMGGLFMHRYKRKSVIQPDYIIRLVCYIHANPLSHGYCEKMQDWKFSSFRTFLSEQPSLIQRKDVLDWFDGKHNFYEQHNLFLQGELNLKDPWRHT